jgi:hypothetical protein
MGSTWQKSAQLDSGKMTHVRKHCFAAACCVAAQVPLVAEGQDTVRLRSENEHPSGGHKSRRSGGLPKGGESKVQIASLAGSFIKLEKNQIRPPASLKYAL